MSEYPTIDKYVPGMYAGKGREFISELPKWIITKMMYGREVSCLYSCLCLLWDVEYEVKDGHILFQWDKLHVDLEERDVNIFYFCLIFAKSEEHFWEQLGNLAENYPVGFKYSFIPKVPAGKGQAKILMGTLEGLIDAPKVIDIVVIGSASPKHIVGGRTYDTVVRFLTTLGYSGSIDLYDPDEISEELIIGNFKVNRVSSSVINFVDLRMKNGRKPFIIYDDAFQRDYGNRILPEPYIVKVRPQPIIPGEHCYVVSRVGDNYYIDTGLQDHKSVEKVLQSRPPSTIVGGGHYLFDPLTHEVAFFGESGTYGRMNVDLLSSIMSTKHYLEYFPRYYLGYGYRGHDPKKTVLCNPCRVSIKAVEGDEVPPKCELRSQFYYYKKEKRIVKNFPKIPDGYRDIGDGCVACIQLARILTGIKSYNGCDPYSSIKLLFAGHVTKSCFREQGIAQAEKIAMVRGHAWKEVSYEYGLQEFLNRYKQAGEHDYKRLIRFTGVKVIKAPVDIHSPKVKGLERRLHGVVWKYIKDGKEEIICDDILTHAFKKGRPMGDKRGHEMTKYDFAVSIGGPYGRIEGTEDKCRSLNRNPCSNATLFVDMPEAVPHRSCDRLIIDAVMVKKVELSLWFMVSAYRGYSLWAPIKRDIMGEAVSEEKFDL